MGCLLIGLLRAVIDTSVVIAALRSRRGASSALLRLVATGRLATLATPALFLEYEEVLKRPAQRAVHGLDHGTIDTFLAALASAIEPVTVHIAWRPQLRDPSDEMVLEAAINGRADVIVTFNVKDFAPAARFGVSVRLPADVLKEARR
jgi:putative PIN family toxin of toxin-antitoxin system